MKKRLQMLLSLALALLLCVGTVACREPEGPTESTYTVSVKDAAGNAIGDVLVNLLKGEESQGMKRLKDGSATFTLPTDDYTVSLVFSEGGTRYWYDTANCQLTADKTETTLVLYQMPSEKEEVWAPVGAQSNHQPHDAYFVSEGSIRVELTSGKRTYFLFHPTRAGEYRISVDNGAAVGYYGGTFNVLMNNMGDMDGDALVLEVQSSHIGNTFVIGVDGSVSSAFLTVERTGDPAHSIEYDPYIPVTDTMHEEYFADCVNWGYEGFTPFDMTSSHVPVYNEQDGYYHLDSKDGPLLFMDLKTDSESGFVASFKTICKTSPVSAYIYDENGNYSHKESYNGLFSQNHFEIVPVSRELARAVQNFGQAQGWFDKDGPNYRFSSVTGAKEELLWLYACGYYTEEPSARDAGGEQSPVTLSALGSSVRLAAGGSVYFSTRANAEVFIKGASADLTVYCGNKTYTADSNGVISFTMPLDQLSLRVTLADDADAADFFTVYEGDPDAIGGR